MTEASEEHRSTGHGSSGGAERSSSSAQATGSDAPSTGSDAPSTESRPVGRSRALVGPFPLREVLFGGGVLLVFLGTLLPFIDGIVRYENFWNTAPLFFVGIGILLPVIALALVAGRRLGSSGLRVGSLSVDQFASVSSVLATTYFFLQTVTQFHVGPLVALIGGLVMLTATVLAPFLPVLKDDFADRPEVPAHPAARSITAAQPRPAKPVKEDAAAQPALTKDTAAKDAAPSGPRFGRKDKSGVNPAAATVLQNGAGLYGVGGAGAVGAGAAASGQSGMEPGTADTSRSTPGDTSADTSRSTPGDTSADTSRSTPGDTSADTSRSVSEASEGGSHAVEDRDAAQDAVEDTTSSTAVQASSPGETRVHEAVREEPAPDTTRPSEERERQEPITATRSAEEEPVVEAFWFAVGSPRPVFDEQTGQEVFTLQPGDWEVGIEDRGSEFLVQDKRTGAIGILRNLRNIERAPQD
ncbi:hypothetical protein [Arthrobacter sp. Ld5]|uniref:hypothetical protein n=1 Tax=Arthrobacter sp. Ld5 TaxID=649152 RepID=UPI003EC0EE6A